MPLVIRHRLVWLSAQSPAVFQVEESWKMVPGELYFMIKISTLTFLSKEEGEKQAWSYTKTHLKKENNLKKLC